MRVRAPELPTSLDWVNSEPLRLDEQRGRVVLIDFFTASCVNCMHVLPDLRYLENKYEDGITVIGIHSPKFDHEKNRETVLKAVNRFHIRHPVASDPGFETWKAYSVRAWPSIAVIDARGGLVGIVPGEGRRAKLDEVVDRLLEQAVMEDNRSFADMPVGRGREPRKSLSFPAKVLATSDRLYISDTGNNRILETTHEGRVVRQFGSGNPGLWDGIGDEVGFCEPMGLALENERLYVADRGNHVIREIKILDAETRTLAGNGQNGRPEGEHFTSPRQVSLSSPWELAATPGDLYIAMAGRHQVWRLDLSDETLERFAGEGREDLSDGNRETATFAQPSGLALSREQLFVADAESSAIRGIYLRRNKVHTLVGKGLFEFGHQDGGPANALLQHPQGICCDENGRLIWIADTYNNAIRTLDTHQQVLNTVPLDYPLNEPGGLSLHGKSLWVANTNAHEIVHVDLVSGDCTPVTITE